MSPTSGTIEPFGEVVVDVVVQTTGRNARANPYVASFEIHSDDVCVCRRQSVEMAIEVVITAKTSAENSYIQVLDATTVEASGELVFRIIPVRSTFLLRCASVSSLRVCACRCRLMTRAW